MHVTSKRLVDRFRLRSGEDFLKGGVVAQPIPFPAQTQLGQRHIFREVWELSRPRNGQEAFDQGNSLLDLSGARINQHQVSGADRPVERVLALWFTFDRAAALANRIFFTLRAGVE